MTPDRLQQQALDTLAASLVGGGRGVTVMPCGSGKTLLGRWLAERLSARVVVVCVPSLPLVPQTIVAYRSDTSWPHAAMIVCSDTTSGRAVSLDDLEMPGWARAEVASSTSPAAVRAFLDGPGPRGRVIVSTYHSAPKVADALRRSGRVADLLVCDEAHRLTGRPRAEFRSVLDNHVLPAKRRLFLTATPVEAAAWASDVDIDLAEAPLSLDDKATFGPTVYRATFAEAVAAGRLVDYNVHVLAASGPDHRGRPGPVHAVLTAAADGASRILAFHTRVSHARRLAETLDGHRLPDGRVIVAEHIEARHRAPRRAAALDRLANPADGTVAVVASARVLSEGVNVPAVDTVVFAEPKSSPVDVVQAVGRAMRRSPGKTRGRIVLATDTARSGMDEDTALSGSAWRHVWITLRALASMDDRFAARLRSKLTPGGPGVANGYGGPGLNLELPDCADLRRWVLRALDTSGAAWWERHAALADHARVHGHARPSKDTTVRGVPIGRWVEYQRTARRQGVLPDDRAEALEALPGWAWDAREVAWWRAAGLWARRHTGRSAPRRPDVAALHEMPAWGADPPRHAYASLAEFAVNTCARHRRGELPAHLTAAAASLPGWQWCLVETDDGRMVDALAEYAAWKRDLNAPHDYVHDDGEPLGAWLTAVRRRRYTGRIAAALELELELLGRPAAWTGLRWQAADTGWRLGYLALRQYVAREHTARVPYQHVEALPDWDMPLSRWCVVQRQQHRLGHLDPDRAAALEQVPGWEWEVTLRPGYRPQLTDTAHGRRTSYVKGCRCQPCTDANAAYETGRGEPDLVPAARARGHLRILLGRGASMKAIARAADLNVKTVTEVEDGTAARIRPESDTAILAVTHETVAAHKKAGAWGGQADPAPTWALLDDMLARGWPKAWINRELGNSSAGLQLKRHRMSAQTATAVADLHHRLGDRTPPPRRQRTPLPTLAEIAAREQQPRRRAS